jgi:hypothetical protein
MITLLAPYSHHTPGHITPQTQPAQTQVTNPSPASSAVLAPRETLDLKTSSDLQLKRKPLIDLSPEVTGGVRRGGLSAGAVAGVATIGLVLAKVSDKSGYLVGTALGGPHAGMVIGGVVAKYTDNKWAGAALGATLGATVYGGAFALGSGLSKRHTIAGAITGGVLGAVSGYAANTSGW